jgi:glycosyltransferase involved in cell wall biosynthesis
LYVGRLSEEKNLGALIEAAAKLSSRFNLRLIFLGDGPMRESLQGHARRLRVPLEFLPFVDHRRLPRYFTGADVFVLPSRTEGHPKVLLEAMSCGVPCVASDVDGNRAILGDGEAGLLFDPGDPVALADRLERVFAEEEFARRLGERARARIVERYDLGVLVAREIDLLRRVAKGA